MATAQERFTINKPVVVLIVGIVIVILIIAITLGVVFAVHKEAPWHQNPFKAIPGDIIARSHSARVEHGDVLVQAEGKNATIHYRQGVLGDTRPTMDVLLLHGAAFTSKNWQDIGTLQLLAAAGYNPMAIDLPGYGQSREVFYSNRGSLIAGVIAALNLNSPVIVSPSMSGAYSMPFLFGPGPLPSEKRAKGFIPVAPVGTSLYRNEMKSSKIPTMIVRGDSDVILGTASTADLSNLPNAEAFIIPGAGHAAYIDQSQAFHKLVYNFLDNLT